MAKEAFLWIVALMLALVCVRSGWLKVTGNASWVRDFHRWAYPDWFRMVVGFCELLSGALLLVPGFAGLGAGIFALIMLGAVYTHATHGELSRIPFNFFLLILALVIVAWRPPFNRVIRKKEKR